ncbi:hypothetical protein DFH07DRAFT_720723, partial [Mycena maculata]
EVPMSFTRLKSLFQMEDGWRNTFQDDRQYTCLQQRNDPTTGFQHVSRSRLDRIYVQHKLFDICRGWKIDQTVVRSDHSLVSMQMICRADQKPGKGRFGLPLYLLKTRKFITEIQRLGRELKVQYNELQHTERTEEHNMQILWAKFKYDSIQHARK